jgi:hypothetical protein
MVNRKNRVILIPLGVLLSFRVVSPALYALMWHVQHGNRIVFRGTKVQVPFGWVAEPGEARMLDFTKYPVLIFGLRKPTSGFDLGKLPDGTPRDLEEIYKSWVTVNCTSWNQTGGVVKGPFTFGTGEKEVVCMTSFPNTPSSDGMASCLLFHRTWMAQFIGSAKDVDTFWGVVRGAATVEETSTRQHQD